MCVIAIKRMGVKMPDEKTLKTMWTNNPHGAGIMYARDGKVYIDKGYMDWTSFIGRIESLGDVTDTALVMHFRIATHGGVIPGNTHPFPVSENVDALSKLRQACKLGVAHNGIIPIEPRAGISDTMEYIATELAPLAKQNPKFYTDKNVLEEIGKRIESKIAILDGQGNIAYYGDFITETDGMIYSNDSYKPRCSAVYTYRDGSYYDWLKDDEDYYCSDNMCPPWDTGRKSVYLMYAGDCKEVLNRGIRDNKNRVMVDDISDLFVDSLGGVYVVDYDNGLAYKVNNYVVRGPNKTARKNKIYRLFKYNEGIRFEFGGDINLLPY